jgi:hypothetical protein
VTWAMAILLRVLKIVWKLKERVVRGGLVQREKRLETQLSGKRSTRLCDNSRETIMGDRWASITQIPEVGRESPNGSGQPSLLDEEFLGDTSGTLLQINNKLWHLK